MSTIRGELSREAREVRMLALKQKLTLLLLMIAAIAASTSSLSPMTSTAWAQEDEFEDEGSNSLEEGPSVRRQLLLRSGRFELTPSFGMSLNDTFVRNLLVGVDFSYHFTNSVGFGGSFHYGIVGLPTDETANVADKGNINDNVKNQLQVSQLQFAADLGIVWTPIFGKMALWGLIINYDVHLFAGGSLLNFSAGCADTSSSVCTGQTYDNIGGLTGGGAFGGGTRIFINDWVAIAFDFRDYLASYSEYSRAPTEDNSELRNFFTVNFGVSFFLPTSVYVSR